MSQLLISLNSVVTISCVIAEQAMRRFLDRNYLTPIDALAKLNDKVQITLKGVVAKTDGTSLWRFYETGPAVEAEQIGIQLGQRFKSVVPCTLFSM